MRRIHRGSDRGQAWTFDALLMLALMVAGVVYAMQVVPIQEYRSVADDLAEAQLEQDVTDLLAVATASTDLLDATVYWNETGGHWVGVERAGPYTRVPTGHPLEVPLAMVFDRTAVGYNIDVVYQTDSGDSVVEPMVYQGTPGAHGVVGSASVVLYDDSYLTKVSDSIKIRNLATFYAPDVFPESRKYNVITVRITAWKR